MGLEEIRGEIDRVDDELARLFSRRMALAARVAQEKRDRGGPVLRAGREEAIVSRLLRQAEPELVVPLRQFCATLFRLSRAHQQLLLEGPPPLAAEIAQALADTPETFPDAATAACQGIEGAYSQIACNQLFENPKILYVRTFDAVFRAVEQGLCRYGVLPIENSSFGSVTQVYDLMKKHHCRIVRGLRLRVDHCLLSRAGSAAKVREIFSHEQALGQCSDFLRSLGDVKITVCENTAVAAQLAAEAGREDAAALSSEECAALYGLRILRRKVQNADNNETRFICISRRTELYPGANRCSMMLTLRHQPGSLVSMLDLPASQGVNLTKLESRPVLGKEFEFLFYFDLDADATRPETMELLCRMAAQAEEFTFLGSYLERTTE